MRMPTVYDDEFFGPPFIRPDGTPQPPIVYSLAYPPIGFFQFGEGPGNSDYHGFYWPIGREESPPILAFTNHDAYALIPEYGGIAAAGRCQMAGDPDRKLWDFELAFDQLELPHPTIDFPEVLKSDEHHRFLTLDPDSPFHNCVVADLKIGDNELEAAEAHYRRAIERLPEYGAAHFGLGYLLRRMRRQEEATIHLRQALIGPLAFWGGCFWADHILPGSFREDWASKCLQWLQRSGGVHESLAEDPVMRNIRELTLETGVARSRDVDLLIPMVDEYRDRGRYLDAIYLWMNIGDRCQMETTSFRERYEMTPRTYGTRLADLLREADLSRRAELVENMLSVMKKPSGLYL